MNKKFYSIWDSNDSIVFARNMSTTSDVAFIIANGGILSKKQSIKLTNNTSKIETFKALDDNSISYFEYYHKSNCLNLQIAGEDLCLFINYVQSNYHYQTIIIVGFSKAAIASYYALTSDKILHTCKLKFIAGGSPWTGTELCDSKELKKIPSRLPWKIVNFFIMIFLKTNLEKDLSPNSESIKGINFEKLNSILDIQYDTNKEN